MAPILIDITRLLYRRFLGRLPTGIDRVSIEYVRHYAPGALGVVGLGIFSAVLTKADSARAFRTLLDPAEPILFLFLKIGFKAIAWQWFGRTKTSAFLFNTGHMGLENNRYAIFLRQRGARPIFMVHDLIPITHPEYCRTGERSRHKVRMLCMLATGCGIIANSQNTLTALRQFAQRQKVPVPDSVVAPLAPGFVASTPGQRPIAEPYFVVLGTIEPRKNHWMLLQIWRRLVEKHGAAAPKLVIIGQLGWEYEDVTNLLERTRVLREYVIQCRRASDQELFTYLHHAQALLFPSFAEGFGMPVAEALSIGVPVIASDLDVFRECAGNLPDYADPLDGRAWLSLIEDYMLQTSAYRASQMARMGEFKAASWTEHFATVDALLARLDAKVSSWPV